MCHLVATLGMAASLFRPFGRRENCRETSNREMEDEFTVERRADIGIVKSSHLLSKRCWPGSVLDA